MNNNAMIKRFSRTCVAALLVGLAVSGCARREAGDEDTAVAPTDGSTEPAGSTPPPPEVGAVRIEVVLSDAAQEQLAASGESIRVDISYGGDPSPVSSLQPNELGMIELGRKTLELNAAGTIDLGESEIDKSRLDQISGQPQLMVNAVSDGRAGKGNLLACSFYWETLGKAVREGVEINCDVLPETRGG